MARYGDISMPFATAASDQPPTAVMPAITAAPDLELLDLRRRQAGLATIWANGESNYVCGFNGGDPGNISPTWSVVADRWSQQQTYGLHAATLEPKRLFGSYLTAFAPSAFRPQGLV